MRIDVTEPPVVRLDVVHPEPTRIDVIHRKVEVTVIDHDTDWLMGGGMGA